MNPVANMEPDERSERTRLYLEEVGSAVVVEVTQRGDAHMRVEQALPFLRLHSAVVDEDGRGAYIDAIRVSTEGGIPRLVMDLVYEGAERASGERVAARDEGTIPYHIVPAAPPRLGSADQSGVRRRRKEEDTVLFSTPIIPEDEDRVSGEVNVLADEAGAHRLALRRGGALLQTAGRAFARGVRALVRELRSWPWRARSVTRPRARRRSFESALLSASFLSPSSPPRRCARHGARWP